MTAPLELPSGHLGKMGDAEFGRGMLDEQHQKVDIPASARNAHREFLQKTLNLCRIACHAPPSPFPPDDPISQGTELF